MSSAPKRDDQQPHEHAGHRDEAHPDDVREPWWSTNFSVLVLLAMFLFTALFVPVGWLKSLQDMLPNEPVNVHATFQKRTAQLDAQLEEQAPELPRAELERLRHDLMLRRILRAGPMSEPHMREATRMLEGFDHQLASEPTPAGKAALRHAHARKLAAAFPRLDPAQLTRELDLFAAQYARALKTSD